MSSLCTRKNIVSNPVEETSSTEQTGATSSTWDRWGLDPSEFELDLDDFSILETTRAFFENIDSLQQCKLDAYCTYEDLTSNLLEDPHYNSCGKTPTQNGLTTVEEIISDAKAKQSAFEDILERVLTHLGMDPNEEIIFDDNRSDEEPIEKSYNKVLTRVPLKSKEMCDIEVRDRYEGNAAFLCDVGRATIVCRSEEQIAKVMEELHYESDVVRIKNRFIQPPYTGIRDILMKVKVDGHIFELQIHLEEILAVARRFNAHHLHQYFRKYFVGDCESVLYKQREEFIFRMGNPEEFDFESSLSSVEATFDPRTSFSDFKDLAEGIKSILEDDDIAALEALEEISKIFSVHELTLKAQKRILSSQMSEEEDSEALLDRFHDMGEVYNEQGDHDKALEWYGRALEGYEAILGKEHPSTLNAINNMALVYHKRREYNKASGVRKSFCY